MAEISDLNQAIKRDVSSSRAVVDQLFTAQFNTGKQSVESKEISEREKVEEFSSGVVPFSNAGVESFIAEKNSFNRILDQVDVLTENEPVIACKSLVKESAGSGTASNSELSFC